MHQEKEVENKISRAYHQENLPGTVCDNFNVTYDDSDWKRMDEEWQYTPPPRDKVRLTKFM